MDELMAKHNPWWMGQEDIAIYYTTNTFSGNIIVAGGGGDAPGSDGTIYSTVV